MWTFKRELIEGDRIERISIFSKDKQVTYMETVLHMVSKKEVENAKSEGYYQPTSFVDEGFIHCSYSHQVCRVANLFYRGKTDLVLLEINKARTGCEAMGS